MGTEERHAADLGPGPHQGTQASAIKDGRVLTASVHEDALRA
jgi:hypothetical protein